MSPGNTPSRSHCYELACLDMFQTQSEHRVILRTHCMTEFTVSAGGEISITIYIPHTAIHPTRVCIVEVWNFNMETGFRISCLPSAPDIRRPVQCRISPLRFVPARPCGAKTPRACIKCPGNRYHPAPGDNVLWGARPGIVLQPERCRLLREGGSVIAGALQSRR